MRLYLHSHGWQWRTLSWLGVVALCAGLLQWVVLPQVGPVRTAAHSLETLGTVLCVATGSGLAQMLPSRCPELEACRSREIISYRVALCALMFLVCVMSVVLTLMAGPPGLSPPGVFRTYVLIAGIALLGSLLRPGWGGLVASIGIVGVCSVAGLVPWGVNILFNPDLTAAGWVVAVCLWAIASVWFCLSEAASVSSS